MIEQTPTPGEQLAQAARAQPELFVAEEDGADAGLAVATTAGSFSGERLAKGDPARYQAILRALAEGMGIRQIARAFRVSANTVAAVRRREGSCIETEKEGLAHLLRLGARLGVERIVDEIGEFRRESLPIAVGILIDKAQLLAGDPTSIVGRQDGAGAGTFADVLAAARAARGEVIEAELAEETGLGAGGAGQNAPAAPAALPARSERGPGVEDGAARPWDSKSHVGSSNYGDSRVRGSTGGSIGPRVATDDQAHPAPPAPPARTPAPPGEGGGRAASDPPRLLPVGGGGGADKQEP